MGNVQVQVERATKVHHALNESEFAHLLFHGVDKQARSFIRNRPDEAVLQALFPEQDFVIWQADAF